MAKLILFQNISQVSEERLHRRKEEKFDIYMRPEAYRLAYIEKIAQLTLIAIREMVKF